MQLSQFVIFCDRGPLKTYLLPHFMRYPAQTPRMCQYLCCALKLPLDKKKNCCASGRNIFQHFAQNVRKYCALRHSKKIFLIQR